MVGSETDPCRGIEVIPHEVAGPNVGPLVADGVLAVVDPSVPGVGVSGGLPLLQGGAGGVESGHRVVPDLHLAAALVALGGGAEDVGVQEGLQILVGVLDEVRPVGDQYLHGCSLGEDDLVGETFPPPLMETIRSMVGDERRKLWDASAGRPDLGDSGR